MPSAQILAFNAVLQEKEPGVLKEMADSRAGQEAQEGLKQHPTSPTLMRTRQMGPEAS